jgi:hypothetical protein
MDVVAKGFVVTFSNEESLKLIKDSAMTVGLVIVMLGADMSLG